MATRIVVSCVSHHIPGAREERHRTLVNKICQMQWSREFDATQDRLVTRGRFRDKNVQCILLLDNGPVESQDVTTIHFMWTGQAFVSTPIPPKMANVLRQDYQFNPSERRKGMTDSEFEVKNGKEAFENMRRRRILSCMRRGEIRPQDQQFLYENPTLRSQLEKEAGTFRNP